MPTLSAQHLDNGRVRLTLSDVGSIDVTATRDDACDVVKLTFERTGGQRQRVTVAIDLDSAERLIEALSIAVAGDRS